MANLHTYPIGAIVDVFERYAGIGPSRRGMVVRQLDDDAGVVVQFDDGGPMSECPLGKTFIVDDTVRRRVFRRAATGPYSIAELEEEIAERRNGLADR